MYGKEYIETHGGRKLNRLPDIDPKSAIDAADTLP
jgi:hypothetical protein